MIWRKRGGPYAEERLKVDSDRYFKIGIFDGRVTLYTKTKVVKWYAIKSMPYDKKAVSYIKSLVNTLLSDTI